MASSKFPEECWNCAFEAVKSYFQVDDLLPEQVDGIRAFLEKGDVFINLPTGYGKFLIYQCLPIASDVLFKKPRGSSVLVVTSPLTTLMEDQVGKVNNLGIPAGIQSANSDRPIPSVQSANSNEDIRRLVNDQITLSLQNTLPRLLQQALEDNRIQNANAQSSSDQAKKSSNTDIPVASPFPVSSVTTHQVKRPNCLIRVATAAALEILEDPVGEDDEGVDPDEIKGLLEDALVLLGNANIRLNNWRQKRFSEFLTEVGKRTLKEDIPTDKHLFPDKFRKIIQSEHDHLSTNTPITTEVPAPRKDVTLKKPVLPPRVDYNIPKLFSINVPSSRTTCRLQYFLENRKLITSDKWILQTINSYIKGYHDYQEIWKATVNEKLSTRREPDNPVDKYVVCVMQDQETIVGHLKKGKSGRFAKTIFYFLRVDNRNSCTVIVTGMPVNLGDGEGMQVPCKLLFEGEKKYVSILEREFTKLKD
ncbi:ATP-dependent DNA helicase Q1 [Stylophora pistillata]|uniref:ATP-dependent DNA helicase Q1 n=1 Tax=Stylophora pistillata TaxID=50429 RepID=A0A2B4RQ75_STYPI|nr:ATP-dependent DNA helicase Q1 [Stylophora pistillata]